MDLYEAVEKWATLIFQLRARSEASSAEMPRSPEETVSLASFPDERSQTRTSAVRLIGSRIPFLIDFGRVFFLFSFQKVFRCDVVNVLLYSLLYSLKFFVVML